MAKEWRELTKLTGEEPLVIEKVRLKDQDIVIEGSFELPPLARLTADDQIFAAAFLGSHGSIKQMEQIFGVSYPTIKSRLNKIAEKLDFVRAEMIETPPDRLEILGRLNRGEINPDEAVKLLGGE
ncbi:MAG: RNA polymerase subunit sigma-70 [candidate division Zixibacteria bacterium HGW-Zixibacteria-1]|nr:MAG: RNA polymerase subunit sigma-70 [candidate division Zixibacteria bacterium HGW-Zixibacteria-1]